MIVNDDDFVVAPCLREGPLSESGRHLVSEARKLPDTPWSQSLRALAVPYLFGSMERAFSARENPTSTLTDAMTRWAKFLMASEGVHDVWPEGAEQQERDVEAITGDHYGSLFAGFDPASYWEEPKRLLKTRLERNGVPMDRISSAEVLDAGCGGGRYTVAWRLLGAKSATGIDMSEIGVADATRRVIASPDLSGVSFELGNVLDLPAESSRFDVVFSNGVLHHSKDWERGIGELIRVLKPGGFGWLYLIEKPGGYFWDVIEILRLVTAGVSREVARDVLRAAGIPPNRRFYMLDHVMVPINIRLTPDEIQSALLRHGAREVRRFTRGADFDRIEQIHSRQPYAEMKFGVGENRFAFTK
jgi:SAM-dependent methyltransferase